MPHALSLLVLAGLFGVGVLLLGACCDCAQVQAGVSTLAVADALRGVLGFMLVAMTALTMGLVVVDADITARRAWQDHHHGAMAVLGIRAETLASDGANGLYKIGRMDDHLREILLAHRYDVPQIVVDVAAATTPVMPSSEPKQRSHTSIHRRRRGTGTAIRRHAQRSSLRFQAGVRLVGNGGHSFVWSDLAPFTGRALPRPSRSADVVVLSDRDGEQRTGAPSDPTRQSVEPVPPACRDPPGRRRKRQLATVLPQRQEVSRRKGRTQVLATGDVVVTDNLGDRVPVCDAELAVLETYFGEELRKVLGSTDTATKPT